MSESDLASSVTHAPHDTTLVDVVVKEDITRRRIKMRKNALNTLKRVKILSKALKRVKIRNLSHF